MEAEYTRQGPLTHGPDPARRPDVFYSAVFGACLIDPNNLPALCCRAQEEAEIREYASRPNVIELIQKRIAPQIFGAERIKEAVACLLFGGSRKARAVPALLEPQTIPPCGLAALCSCASMLVGALLSFVSSMAAS